ncbi:MAG: heparinase II/III family protein, partial [Burkholderiales bacterium]
MTFRFLNETLPQGNGRWGEGAPSQLWRYNLHYFDDLNAFDAEDRHRWHVEAIAKWIRDNPPGRGDAWAPYPTSLRVVNWIKRTLGGGGLEERAVHSLAIQVRSLSRRLEYHLLGNHLFVNAKALVFAGLFFEGEEAEFWLEKGMRILAREMPEQILADGGQFERSPMYHALALEDVLDLINLASAFSGGVPEKWRAFVGSWPAIAQRMRAWLSTMCHPDGEIAFFNDAAIGIAPSPAELERYASELVGAQDMAIAGATEGGGEAGASLRVLHLVESGYVRADAPDAALLIDVAPVGPDYLPGHAHADTLSFELSLFGQRVIVNG